MKPRHAFLVAVAASALVLAVVLLQAGRQSREIADLRARIAASQSAQPEEPPSQRMAASVAAYMALAAVKQSQSTTTADVPGLPEAPKKGEPSPADVHARYEAAFANDNRDPGWAREARRTVDARLPSLLPEGSSLRAVECRGTMCRFESLHKTYENYMSFVQAALGDPDRRLWNAASYSAPLNDDPAEGVFVTYIAREGQQLPQVGE